MADHTDAPETVDWNRRLDLSLRLRAACVAYDEVLNRDGSYTALFSDDAEVAELRRAAGLACGLEEPAP